MDPAVVDEVRAAIQDAINSDVGREIAEAIRDAARDTRRAIPELTRLADAAAAGWQDRNFRVEQRDTETKTLQLGANGSLELKNVSGNITVTAGSGRDTTVQIVRLSKGRTDADAKLGLDRVKVQVDARGDRATVDATYPNENRPPYSVSVDYTVTAPAGTRLTVRSISGNATVKGITGDVSVDVVSGGIRITDAGNVSSATAISGDVQITNANVNGSLNVSTVSGTMTLDQIKCRRLSGSVISGEVHAKDVSCDNAELKSLVRQRGLHRPAREKRPLRAADALGQRARDDHRIGGIRAAGEHVLGAGPAGPAPGAATLDDDAQVRPRHGRRRQRRRDRDRVQRRCGDY